MTACVRVYWRRYGNGRRLRAEWPDNFPDDPQRVGSAEGSPGLAEDMVWDMAQFKAQELGLPLVDETREVTS